MPYKPLRTSDATDARTAVSRVQLPEAGVNKKFIKGDHYQSGKGWIGPTVSPEEDGGITVMEEIERSFTSRNASLEVCSRHRDGIMGREPSWSFATVRAIEANEALTEEESAEVREVEAELTVWWDRRQVHKRLQEAALTLLHQGRSELRLFIPKGRLKPTDDGGLVARATSKPEALRMIYLDSPDPTNAAVLNDEETMEEVALHLYKQGDVDVLEVCYVDETGVDGPEKAPTILRVVLQEGETSNTYPLGGRLLQHEMQRELFMTKQVQEQQRALNLAVSMVPRTVVTAGFLERVITGAQMPGHWVDDPKAPTGQRFVPLPLHVGPGSTNFLEPSTHTDRDGRTSFASPNVHWRDPISPDAAVKAKHSHYEDILHETDQAHYLLASSEYVSAISRVEARIDFLNSLKRTQVPVEQAGRWLLETVYALAEAIVSGGVAQANTRMSRLRATFRCHLQTGALSADEQRIVLERYEKGLIAHEDALTLLGTDDVDAVTAKINSQPGGDLNLSQRQAEVFKQWLDAGVPAEYAAQRAGLPETEIRLLAKVPTPLEVEKQKLAAQAALAPPPPPVAE